jgi:hypothetical protein
VYIEKDQIWDFLEFWNYFSKEKGIENKRRGLGVKLFSKINSGIISLWNKDRENKY